MVDELNRKSGILNHPRMSGVRSHELPIGRGNGGVKHSVVAVAVGNRGIAERSAWVGACIVALASALPAPARATSGLPSAGIFTEASLYNDDGAIRYFSQDVLLKQIGQTLVESSPFGEFSPGMAKSWRFSENRMIITFTLRHGMTFHSGRQIDAPTVVRALNRRFYDGGNIIHDILARNLKGFSEGSSTKTCPCLKAIANDQLALELSRPFNAMIALLSASNAVILNPDARAHDLLDGSGPYALRRVDNSYFLIPFPRYQGTYPARNQGFRLALAAKNDEKSAIIKNINAGSTDYVFTPTAAIAKEASSSDYTIRTLPMMGRIGMYFNTRSPRMRNAGQRAALFDLLHRFIAEHPLAGVQAADDIYPRGMMGYKSRLKDPPSPIRLKEVKKLLKGSTVDLDGISPDIYGAKQKLGEFLLQYGVTMTYRVLDGDYVRAFKTSTADVFVMGNSDPYLDPSASVGMLMQMDVLTNEQALAEKLASLFEAGLAADDIRHKIAQFSAIGTLAIDHHIYLPLAQPSVFELFRVASGIVPPPTKYRYAPMLSELEMSGARGHP